jgi:hypothetical protein
MGDRQPDTSDVIWTIEAGGKTLDEVPTAMELLQKDLSNTCWIKSVTYLLVCQFLLENMKVSVPAEQKELAWHWGFPTQV